MIAIIVDAYLYYTDSAIEIMVTLLVFPFFASAWQTFNFLNCFSVYITEESIIRTFPNQVEIKWSEISKIKRTGIILKMTSISGEKFLDNIVIPNNVILNKEEIFSLFTDEARTKAAKEVID